jgi:hypothetical protein
MPSSRSPAPGEAKCRPRAKPECISREVRAPQGKRNRRNSNVSKILPLTTFRTIDLGGGKIPGRLFSRFCAESRVFLFEQKAQAAEPFREGKPVTQTGKRNLHHQRDKSGDDQGNCPQQIEIEPSAFQEGEAELLISFVKENCQEARYKQQAQGVNQNS